MNFTYINFENHQITPSLKVSPYLLKFVAKWNLAQPYKIVNKVLFKHGCINIGFTFKSWSKMEFPDYTFKNSPCMRMNMQTNLLFAALLNAEPPVGLSLGKIESGQVEKEPSHTRQFIVLLSGLDYCICKFRKKEKSLFASVFPTHKNLPQNLPNFLCPPKSRGGFFCPGLKFFYIYFK